jgi:hypothetical protein
VTATESRVDHREIYFPDHMREMVHYSYPSPDRRWVLMVEMGRSGGFGQRCRIISFDGSSAMREVGPEGGCASAAWSPDGDWMYFAAQVDGASHLWRQRFPDGAPEQLTFGPTEEEHVTVSSDGRFLVTSVGQRRTSLWLHDSAGDKPLTAEGMASAPRLSLDGRRVYYLLQQTSASPGNELRVLDLTTGASERVLPGLSIMDFDIAPDESEVAFTRVGLGTGPGVWLAPLDRGEPPHEVARSADQVRFGARGELVFRSLEQTRNVVARMSRDGTEREVIADRPIIGLLDLSPDGAWAIAVAPGAAESSSLAISLEGGEVRVICALFSCQADWSEDGRFFIVSLPTRDNDQLARTNLVLPVPAGEAFPPLPPEGLTLDELDEVLAQPGARAIEGANMVPFAFGPDPSTYGFEKIETQRNLFRIPFE